MTLEGIWAELDKARLHALLREAVECYSPSYAEGPVLERFDAALDELGVPHRRQLIDGPNEGRANLIVELGPEPLGLIWVGHMDTIPLLTDEALKARQQGDRLYGLGTADMKSGCAAIIEALGAVKSSGVLLRRGLVAALVVGEEEYGDGTDALPSELSAPVTIVGEPTGLVPCLSHYGHVEVHMKAEGSCAHAALPEIGANAIHALLDWVQQLWGELAALPEAHALGLNLREIRGGDSRFVVAAACEALLDVHFPPAMGAAHFGVWIDRARDSALQRHPAVKMTWENSFSAEGFELRPSDFGALRRAYDKSGLAFDPGVFRSHSDAAVLASRGHAPILCGPGRFEVAHTPSEWVSLEETWQASRLYAAIIHEQCVSDET